MSILLIDAQGAGSVGRAVVEWVPAGIRSVAGVLEKQGADYDFTLIEELLRHPEKYGGHDTFFISAMSSDAPIVSAALRGVLKNKWVVYGGPITFDVEECFDKLGADIAVIGEGERAILKLLDSGLKEGVMPENKVLSGIKGIAYKDNEGRINTNAQDIYLSKDELNSIIPSTSIATKYPYFEDIGVAVEILRGCSNFHRAKDYHGRRCLPGCVNCTGDDLLLRLTCPVGVPAGCGFCSVGGLYGPPRSREQKTILDEMKSLIDLGVSKMSFIVPDPLDYKREELVAPDPLTDPAKPEPNYEELEKLLKGFWDIKEIQEGDAHVTIRDIKATLVTDKSAELLKKYFPTSIIGLGCESGSEEHCIKLGRGYSPEAVSKATEILNRHGIFPKINLIVGLPGQDRRTVEETLRFMERLEDKVLYFDAARFEALPATAFADMPSDYGPVKDVNIKRIFEKVNSIHVRHIDKQIGDRWEVLIGFYDEMLSGGAVEDGGKGPKRRFRQLAGVVGYPLSKEKDLNSMATVVRIIDPPPGLKTGERAVVEITGHALLGFRVIPEGRIII